MVIVMAKDREIICKYYICKGQCKKNRDAEFRGICQHCDAYVKMPGGKPARTDNRTKKLERIVNKENKNNERDF